MELNSELQNMRFQKSSS